MKRTIILASISVLCFLQTGWGQVPRTMSYQGVLKDDGGNPVNDSKAITFRLYDVETDGTALWSEPQSVVVSQGVFSVILGETDPLPDSFPAPAWLGIDIDGSELSPRTPLTAAPYAIIARNNWSLTGNSGTTAGTNFLGTSDDVPLELHVNNTRALRLEPNATSPNVIGGYSGNSVTGGVLGATIGGGGYSVYVNQVTANYGTVGGGQGNTASGLLATVSGGIRNTASGYSATIGGGVSNAASSTDATVGGGIQNNASSWYATVGGGIQNTASGSDATVPGGWYNVAAGGGSFAAGRRAKAVHDGAFVWADQTDADFASTAVNEFAVRATGGFRFLTSVDGSGLRLEPGDSPNVIGGYSGNTVTSGVVGATIGGGGADLNTNRVIDNYCTVAGGQNNQAGDDPGVTDDFPYATVGGGEGNTASSAWSTVGGGQINTASGASSTIGGGWSNTASGGASTVGGGHDNNASGGNATVGGGQVNTASGSSAFVGGGYNNIASGSNATVGGGGGNTANNWATVPGGYNNSASGIFGFAAGRRAKANHTATFVWADFSVEADFASTADNQFLIRAAGGVGIGTTNPGAKLDVGQYDETVLNLDVLKLNNNHQSANASLRTLSRIAGQDASAIITYRDGTSTGGALKFQVSNSSWALVDRMVIVRSGNVGIGTTIPQYKLDVIGDIRATGSVYYGGTEGNLDGSVYNKPDYVFEGEYEVMTTEEVEKYLKKEGHLPWMTSVKQEREENGEAVNITRMAFETVETAENLQLQIIELTKLGKEQQREIEALQAAVAALRLSSGQAPSTSSGQAPSTSSGQAPSTSSGQAPSTSSGQALEAQVKVAVRE